MEQSLRLYLPARLVKKFASDPSLLKPGAKKQRLTILFSDIAGFTSITEGMDPDELAKLMNAYFQTAVDDCIHFTEGTIVKYIGDAIFAFWNAPDPQDDHPFRAADAALRFRDQDKHEFNGKKVLTRIGLHTGEANVGNFGSTTRVDYTAFGEMAALREQNVQVAAGQIGQPPVPRGLDFQYTMTTLGRLTNPGRVRQHHHQDRFAGRGDPLARRRRVERAPRARTRSARLTANRRSAWPCTNYPAATRWRRPGW